MRPWGIILFARNIESRDQLRALTDDLREKSGNAHLPILIDQEGGRVARPKPPLLPAYPPMGLYGELFEKDKAAAVEAARSARPCWRKICLHWAFRLIAALVLICACRKPLM